MKQQTFRDWIELKRWVNNFDNVNFGLHVQINGCTFPLKQQHAFRMLRQVEAVDIKVKNVDGTIFIKDFKPTR